MASTLIKQVASVALVLVAAAFSTAASAVPGPLFPQCPAVGANTGCQLLITINPGGGFTVAADPNAPNNGPYDGVEDTLVGVVNNSGVPVSSLAISSNTDIFGFDGDGPCTVTPNPGNCNSSDPNGYGGPGVTFSNITNNNQTGVINFTPALANNGTAWFGLEEALTASSIVPAVTAVPAPTLSPWAMIFLGIALLGGLVLRRRRA